MTLHSINREQRRFVLKSGSGYSCLGFDFAAQRTQAVADWLQRPDLAPPARKGTRKAYAAYLVAMEAGRQHNASTGARCNAELTPALIPFEGQRVEVTTPDGESSRFIVGKSGGWMPIHLEIKRRDSTGGGAVYFPAGSKVRRV